MNGAAVDGIELPGKGQENAVTAIQTMNDVDVRSELEHRQGKSEVARLGSFLKKFKNKTKKVGGKVVETTKKVARSVRATFVRE